MNRSGKHAEHSAARFLQSQGLQLLESNYRCRFGEIDLVMRDGAELVFVEVRLRSRSDFGSAAESISSHKQQKLILAARHYLAQHGEMPCRFDAMLTAQGDGSGFQWIRNAFDS